MQTIYRKTPLGVAEIETRALKLPQRLRSLLIMIDGKRSAASLAAMAQAEQSLATLQEQGLIEAAEVAPEPAAPAPASAPAAPRRSASFEARRRSIVRALNDTLGPAAESLAIKFERAKDADELRVHLPQLLDLVATMRGKAFSDNFEARLQQTLSDPGEPSTR